MLVNIREVEFNVQGDESWWDKIVRNKKEPYTYKIFDQFISPSHNYIDLGVFIGSTVLYGAKKAKHCFCADPDPYSNYRFLRNLNLNPDIINKVTFFRGCVGDKTGTVKFGSPDFGNSSSSMFSDKDAIVAKSLTFQKFVESYKIDNVNFIKIDIEGGEAVVVPSAAEMIKSMDAVLFLSFHLHNFPNQAQDCSNICDSLSFYKYIYDRNGKLITMDDLRAGLLTVGGSKKIDRKWGIFEGVFTNRPWEK